MTPTLLIMAAGLGQRYGGGKQIDRLGPDGEMLIDYAIFDAHRAGLSHVVFVIREELTEAFDELRAGLPRGITTAVVYQRLDQLPPWFTPPAGRTKPWGTVHAVLAARDAIHTPFAVVNADDFYGAEAYQRAAQACAVAQTTGRAAIVGLQLDSTLSDHGPVARGIPQVRDGRLVSMDEVRSVQRGPDGITGLVRGETRHYTGREVASMNCWVFPTSAFTLLGDAFDRFLREHGQDTSAESPLPEAVSELVKAGQMEVDVVSAPGPWFGLTHREDRGKVQEGLRALAARGVYPTPLWPKQDRP